MALRRQDKWGVEHFRHCGAHVPDKRGQNREHQRGNRQRHVQKQIAKLPEKREAIEIQRYHASGRQPTTLYCNH